jgi:hypothetical protein
MSLENTEAEVKRLLITRILYLNEEINRYQKESIEFRELLSKNGVIDEQVNEKKRCPNEYNLFVQSEMNKMKSLYPNMKPQQIMSIIGMKWRENKGQASKASKVYKTESVSESVWTPGPIPDKKPRKKSDYTQFIKAETQTLKAQGIPAKEAYSMAMEKWKSHPSNKKNLSVEG